MNQRSVQLTLYRYFFFVIMVYSSCKLPWLEIVLLVLQFGHIYSSRAGDRINRETVWQHPFVRFLMNPCGLTNLPDANEMSLNPSTSVRYWSLMNMGVNQVLGNGMIDSETLHNLNHIAEVLPSTNPEFANELYRSLHTLRATTLEVRRQSNLPQCEGIELQTLLLPALPLTGAYPIRDMYKVLLLLDAHLHIMVRDHSDNDRVCMNESRALRHEFYRLTGKVEAVLCMLLQVCPSPQLIPVIESVVQHGLYRYSDCSLRLTRDCLVLTNTEHWLRGVLQVIEQSSHSLQLADI